MNLDGIRLVRNILLRTLVVIFGLNLVMYVSTFAFWDTWTNLVSQWFHISPDCLGPMMLNFFGAVKFIAIYVLLAPAIALHWTLKAEKTA